MRWRSKRRNVKDGNDSLLNGMLLQLTAEEDELDSVRTQIEQHATVLGSVSEKARTVVVMELKELSKAMLPIVHRSQSTAGESANERHLHVAQFYLNFLHGRVLPLVQISEEIVQRLAVVLPDKTLVVERKAVLEGKKFILNLVDNARLKSLDLIINATEEEQKCRRAFNQQFEKITQLLQ